MGLIDTANFLYKNSKSKCLELKVLYGEICFSI